MRKGKIAGNKVRHLIRYQAESALCGNLVFYSKRDGKLGSSLSSEQKSEIILYLHFRKITLVAEWRTDCGKTKAKEETILEASATVWERNYLG